MSWFDEDPLVEQAAVPSPPPPGTGTRQKVKHPKTPEEFPYESVEDRRRAAEMQLAIRKQELQGASAEQAKDIQSEIARLQKEFPDVQAAAIDTGTPVQTADFGDPEVKPTAWFEGDPLSEPSWGETIAAIPGTVFGKIKQALGGAMQSLAETDIEGQIAAERGGRQVTSKPSEFQPNTALAQSGREVAEAGKKHVQETMPENLTFWKQAVVSGVSDVVVQAPALAAGIATRSPVIPLAAAGTLSYNTEYAEQREAGIEPGAAGMHSAIGATGEVLTELLPLKFMTEAIPGKTLKMIVSAIAADIPGELAQTTIQSVNAKYSRNPDMTWEEYGQDLLDTLGATLVASPLLAGGAAGLQRFHGAEKPAGEQTPAAEEVPVEQPPAAEQGGVNAPLTTPNIDADTVVPDSDRLARAIDAMNAIDPDSIGDQELEESRKIVEEFENSKKAPGIPQAEVHWPQLATAPTDVVDVGELGATARQAQNAEGYVNPNKGDRLDRTVSFASDTNAIGLTPRQFVPKPATYVIGEPTPDRPAELLQPMMETAEQWRQKWMPDSTLVLSNEQLFTDSALGWHYSMGPKKHMIVPAVLRKAKDLNRFNVNTQAGVFYNLSHEFGHALFLERLMEGIPATMQGRISSEGRAGVISEEAISALPDVAAQQVLREYNNIKARIMDGSMTAQEFIDSWIGPAKRGRDFLKELGVSPNDRANSVMRAVVRRAQQNSRIGDEMSRTQMRDKLSEDFFSLEEYFAEQTARYAYASKQDQQTPLGKFLSKGLNSLRSFFTGLKSEGVVAPGVKFQEWLDGLPQVSRLAREPEEISKTKQKAGKKKTIAAPRIPQKIAAPEDIMIEAERKASRKVKKKKVEKVAHNKATEQTEKTQEQLARGMIVNLVRTGDIERGDSTYNEMMSLVARKEWDELKDMLQDHGVKRVKFDIDPRGMPVPNRKWQNFADPEFKAWFGDWDGSPEESSVVRVGVFSDSNDGILVVDTKRNSPPLVSFTSLERLKKGQNVFYASTVRGTVFTDSVLPAPGDDPSIVPVVLNIRNPLIVASPEDSAGMTREQLQQQGYDGIVYRNDLEGHVSFVVFSLDQVQIVPNRSPYERGSGLHMELDHDAATPEGENAGRFYGSVKNFLKEPGPMRRALRKALHAGARNFLQIQQMAHLNPQDDDLTFFSDNAMESVRDRSRLIAPSDRITGVWNGKSQKDIDTISKILQDEMDGRTHWFALTKIKKKIPTSPNPVDWHKYQLTDTAKAEMKKRGIDADSEKGAELAALILDIKNDVLNLINEAEQRMMEILYFRYGANEGVMLSARRRLAKQFQEIRSIPFFPPARFGPYVVVVKKKNARGGYEVVHQEHFEDEGQWLAAYRRMKSKEGLDEQILHRHLTDDEYVLMNLPAEFLDTAASELNLSEEQAALLEEILQPMKGDKILSQFDKKRLGVTGQTKDALRSYANWTSHFSNQISKLKYRKLLNVALSGMDKRIRAAEEGVNTEELHRLRHLRRMMGETRDYMMSPPTEYQYARAAVSIAYLWANVKTAGLNFFGLMTNYYNLARKHGAFKGDAMFMKAVYNAMAMTKITSLNDIRQNNAVDPQLVRAMDRATQEGVTTQSYAYHLAGVANASLGQRVKALKPGTRAWQKVVDIGMLPFRFTEITSRRISFMAAMAEQMENKTIAFEQQYQNAVKEVAITQNDYTLANRVKIMRGGKGVRNLLPLATIFMSFAQHMSFHALGGYEIGQRRLLEQQIKKGELPESARMGKASWIHGYTSRIWLLFFLLAGYEGMPLMENVLDLVTWAWRKMGGKKPIRQELRELVQGLNMDPMTMSRGLMHNVAGFDLSRSVGLGRVVPGTETAASGVPQDFEKGLGGLALDLFGVAGSMLKFGASLYEKGFWEGMTRAPGGVGNIYTAYYWTEYGVRGPNDAQVTIERGEDGRERVRDLTDVEIMGKALGFNPSVVSENREKLYGQYEVQMYWRSKRNGLLEKWDEANWKDDDELKKDVKQEIREFNLKVREDKEFRRLQILGGDLSDRERRRRRAQRDMERGKIRDKRTRGAQESFRESFERPADAQ